MRTEAEWRTFLAQARQLQDDRVDKWLRRLNRDRVVTRQLAPLPTSVARSNRAAEEVLTWLKGQWVGRAASYRNAERTNRLLKLYVLHQRHADAVARALRCGGLGNRSREKY